MKKRITFVLVVIGGLLAPFGVAAAHDIIVNPGTPCGDNIPLAILSWDGIDEQGVDQGPASRTVTAGIFLDGGETAIKSVELTSPDFFAEVFVTAGPGIHQIEVRPISSWGDGEPADIDDGRTVTVELDGICVQSTTTTTTTTVPELPSTTTVPTVTFPPCAIGDGEPCPYDTVPTTTPPVDVPEITTQIVEHTPDFTG